MITMYFTDEKSFAEVTEWLDQNLASSSSHRVEDGFDKVGQAKSSGYRVVRKIPVLAVELADEKSAAKFMLRWSDFSTNERPRPVSLFQVGTW